MRFGELGQWYGDVSIKGIIPTLLLGIKNAMQVSDISHVAWPQIMPDGNRAVMEWRSHD
jgi:hypothetical protein